MDTGRYINEAELNDICAYHEINPMFLNYLIKMVNYKIVIIGDDSGSMNRLTNLGDTRWDELCKFIHTVFSLTKFVENNPIDIYFLNRPSILNVKRMEDISMAFENRPKGYTPIVPVLKNILNQPLGDYEGRIIIIATDGEPTDEYNKVNIEQLKNTLTFERSGADYITFLACTDDKDCLKYLNKWDKEIINVDVVDDFISEREEVLLAQGEDFRFTYADYVVKIVMGCVIHELDILDENLHVKKETPRRSLKSLKSSSIEKQKVEINDNDVHKKRRCIIS